MSGSGAMSPSMLNTPSVMTRTVRSAPPVRGPHLAQGGAQGVHVGVREDLALGLGEPDAVDDAGVVQLVD